MRNLLAMTVAVAALSTMVCAEGLQVGSDVGAFYVKDVTGPKAGEKLCYRCRYGGRPVVSVFTRNTDGQVATLIKQLDGVVGKNQEKDMAAFVVLLADEPESKEGDLKSIAEKHAVTNTPLTTFDGSAGPQNYQLSKDAEVTVMMWVNGKLKVNEVCQAKDLTQDRISTLVGKTSEILN